MGGMPGAPGQMTFRAVRYAPEHPAFVGRELCAGASLEEELAKQPVHMPFGPGRAKGSKRP